MNYFNQALSKQEVLSHVGSVKQLAGAQRLVCDEGKGKGSSIIRVRNGNGLDVNIIADKALDIFDIYYKGTPLAWISKNGLVANQTYDDRNLGWLRNFGGGMLVTCGMRNVGSPNDLNGEHFGLHGRVASIPAENVSVNEYWSNDIFYVEIKGVIRESNVFGENLVCHRTITFSSDINEIKIDDCIVNEGFRDEPLALLYHFNWGSPLVSEGSELTMETVKTEVRDNNATQDSWNTFQRPTKDFSEIVYLHHLKADESNTVACKLTNKNLGIGLEMQWNSKQLPYFTQWKMMGRSEYVLGLEPGNCFPNGRAAELQQGRMETLHPFEKKQVSITVKIFDL